MEDFKKDSLPKYNEKLNRSKYLYQKMKMNIKKYISLIYLNY